MTASTSSPASNHDNYRDLAVKEGPGDQRGARNPPRRATIAAMATRKRGTRPDFQPGWEPNTLPEEEVLRRGGQLFDDGIY